MKARNPYSRKSSLKRFFSTQNSPRDAVISKKRETGHFRNILDMLNAPDEEVQGIIKDFNQRAIETRRFRKVTFRK